MKTIRKNVFETNSSSCHVITICGKNMLKKFMDHEVLAVHDFTIHDDAGAMQEVVVDSEFITLEEAWAALEKGLSETPENYDLKKLKALSDEGKFNKDIFNKVISHKYEDDEDIEWYVRDALEFIFDKRVYWNNGDYDSNPFLAGAGVPLTFDGIEGPITTINAEVIC